MKKVYIAFVFNRGEENRDYEKELVAMLAKEGISPEISHYESNVNVIYESKPLRPGLIFSKFPQVRGILVPYAHSFVYFFYRPVGSAKVAARTHMELLWAGSKEGVAMTIPMVSTFSWRRQAVAHEWIHACHVMKIRHRIPTVDTMDKYSGPLDGVEENMEQLRPHWETILKKPKALSMLEAIVDTLQQLIATMMQLIQQKEKEEMPEEIIDPAPDGKWYCLHHSATSRDFTRAESIIRYHENSGKYGGKCFYDHIIDKDGIFYSPEAIVKKRGTTDVCVIGDFTREKPTDQQLATLKALITNQSWTTHKELAKKGMASPSLCPGNLTDYL